MIKFLAIWLMVIFALAGIGAFFTAWSMALFWMSTLGPVLGPIAVSAGVLIVPTTIIAYAIYSAEKGSN